MDIPGLPPMPMSSAMPDPKSLASQARSAGARATETAAEGFESLFASLLVKQMRQTLEPDSMFGEDRGEVLGGLFDFYMGQHLAQSGRLGVGDMIRRQWQLHPDRVTEADGRQPITDSRHF